MVVFNEPQSLRAPNQRRHWLDLRRDERQNSPNTVTNQLSRHQIFDL